MWSGKAYQMFIDECSVVAQELEACSGSLTVSSMSTVSRLAHRLRGAAGFFGMKELQQHCKSLEECLKGDVPDLEIAHQLILKVIGSARNCTLPSAAK